jgi:hypothetical protein
MRKLVSLNFLNFVPIWVLLIDLESANPIPAKVPSKVPFPTKSNQLVGVGPKIEHVKGTSVEDILENDFETTLERQEKIEQIFQVKDNVGFVPKPNRRKELVETHIRRPQYSVGRVTLLCEWVNSLHLWPHNLTISDLHKQFCNGLLLIKLVKMLIPDLHFVHVNEKPLAKKSALENLEQALGHVWRSKRLNNSRIPTGTDIFSGNTAKLAVLLNELFGVYVVKPLLKDAMKILSWYNYVLKQYQRALPDFVIADGDLAGVWPHFQSGTSLFCILYHFFGQSQIGSGPDSQKIDPLRIVGDPTSICDFRDNLTYIFRLLRLLDIDILWTAEDWISNPDTEFILLQLFYIYDALKLRQCSLPPAQGDRPGITSGPNGEALVVGLIFSDAPSSLRFIPKTQKAVRLGYDHDSMPLLPVGTISPNPRFTRHGQLPLGMLSQQHDKIASIETKVLTQKTFEKVDWNSRTTVQTEKENVDGFHLVSILRDHHAVVDKETFPNLMDSSSLTFWEPPLMSGKVDGILDTRRIESRESREVLSNEINDMIVLLEEEMTGAQIRIIAYEEELAGKYSSLEASIDDSSLQDYERSLIDLEEKRLLLEQEKRSLQVSLSCDIFVLFLFCCVRNISLESYL